jgi:hypothetical protein
MNTAPFSTLRVLLSGTVLVALLLSAMPLGAQSARRTVSADLDTIFRKNWEIGVDLLPLIDRENVPATSLFGRYNFGYKNGRSHALRLRAGVDSRTSNFTNADQGDIGRYYYEDHLPYLSIGYQRNTYFSHRSFWYWGGDLMFGSTPGTISNVQYPVGLVGPGGDSVLYSARYRTLTGGVSGIIGLQINLFKNVSLSLESSLMAWYADYHIEGRTYYEYDRSITISEGYNDSQEFVMKFRPIHTINLVYTLNKKRHVRHKT